MLRTVESWWFTEKPGHTHSLTTKSVLICFCTMTACIVYRVGIKPHVQQGTLPMHHHLVGAGWEAGTHCWGSLNNICKTKRPLSHACVWAERPGGCNA